jgi:toluene monooxygenase system protein B
MALFPLFSLFEDDFVVQVVPVDTEDNMDEVAKKCAVHSIDRRVRVKEGVLRVKRHSNGELFPRDMKVIEASLLPTETIDVIYMEN